MCALDRTRSTKFKEAKEMDSDDESMQDLDEKDKEFDSSWDRAFHWNESDLPSFTSSDGTSDDVSMVETLCISDMDGSEEDYGDIGDGQIQNSRLKFIQILLHDPHLSCPCLDTK